MRSFRFRDDRNRRSVLGEFMPPTYPKSLVPPHDLGFVSNQSCFLAAIWSSWRWNSTHAHTPLPLSSWQSILILVVLFLYAGAHRRTHQVSMDDWKRKSPAARGSTWSRGATDSERSDSDERFPLPFLAPCYWIDYPFWTGGFYPWFFCLFFQHWRRKAHTQQGESAHPTNQHKGESIRCPNQKQHMLCDFRLALARGTYRYLVETK